TVAAADSDRGEIIRMGRAAMARLLLEAPPPSPVDATTAVLGRGELLETTVLRSCATVAVIAPHGGSIEDETDEQADLVASHPSLGGAAWICRAPARARV